MTFILFACNNPFAPKLADSQAGSLVLGDQKTVEGLFANFRYAYNFKDTLVYGRLLADDFAFVYRNYDRGMDESWGRNEDLITTNGLFHASQSLDLVWHDVVLSIGDSTLLDISRGFTLNIVFSHNDFVSIQGRAIFRIARPSILDEWKIIRWRDESNY